jgi:polyisoprenoid-binding protein YceI
VTHLRRALPLLALAVLASALPVRAADLYTIDRRSGRIEFTVSHLGLFSSHGEFTRFDSRLTIDRAHPERTKVAVVIHVDSVSMPWANAADLLRSAEFFDAARYPDARFASTEVIPVSADHYTVRGTLELHGVTRPIELDAGLVDRHFDPASKYEVADFVVHGHIERSAFGITAEPTFISDRVDLNILARLILVEPPHAE